MSYFPVVFLLDVGEERRVGEVPFAARTPEFALGFFLILGHKFVVLPALLFAHIIINPKAQPTT